MYSVQSIKLSIKDKRSQFSISPTNLSSTFKTLLSNFFLPLMAINKKPNKLTPRFQLIIIFFINQQIQNDSFRKHPNMNSNQHTNCLIYQFYLRQSISLLQYQLYYIINRI
ncbi:hypothetical protein pb186bvf_012702 [Paramecium bursaria]